MQDTVWEPDNPTAVTEIYNRAIQNTPFCAPVDNRTMEQAMEGESCCKAAKHMSGQRLWLAGARDRPDGMVHVALEHQKTEEPHTGIIRFFWYRRGSRAAGEALLDTAETYLREQGVHRVVAWHYDHTYPFYHVEHAYMTQQLDHVHAMLGLCGYTCLGTEMVLGWPNFMPQTPEPIPLHVELTFEWLSGRGERPGLRLQAYHGQERIGICECVSLGEVAHTPANEESVYTRWLGVEEPWRRMGVGRYLVRYALVALHQAGYRHATICTLGDNYPAYLLYTNLGYHTVDRTQAYQKCLR